MTQPSTEIRVGVDVGNQKHYVAIGLSNGTRLDEFSISHTPEGISHFFERIEKQQAIHPFPVAVAMEGYNGYARPIDAYVLEKGYRLFNVNNTKLARFKEVFSGPAKSDPIDAWKILELFTLKDSLPLAKNALQEVIKADIEQDKLKRITRRRRALVEEKTRIANRLQADLQSICPGLLELTGSVSNLWFLRFLTARENVVQLARLQRKSLLKIKGVGDKYVRLITAWQKTTKFSPDAIWAGQMVIRDAQRILELLQEIAQMDQAVALLVKDSRVASRLMSMPGFGVICAGEIVGEIGAVQRFAYASSLALYLGMAVLDNKSGKYEGTKRPRNINTRAKAAMMTAVARHIDAVEEARRYYDKKRAEGKRHNQAIRSLGRHLVRVIWSMIKHDRDYVVKGELIPCSVDKFTELPVERSTATCSWDHLESYDENKSKINSPCSCKEEARLLVLG